MGLWNVQQDLFCVWDTGLATKFCGIRDSNKVSVLQDAK